MGDKNNTNSDLQAMHSFINEFWQLVKKYWTPEDASAYWDGLVNDADSLAEKYLDIQTAKALIVAFLKDKQEEFKREQAGKTAAGQAGPGEG